MNNKDDMGMDYNDKVYMDDELQQKKKKRTKIWFIVLIVAAVVFVGASLAAGILNMERPQTFSIRGAKITLTNKFKVDEETKDDCYIFLTDEYAACEFFVADPVEIKTVEAAKDYYKNLYDLKNVQFYNRDGLSYFTCTEDVEEGYVLSNVIFLFDKDGVIYIAWFSTPEENYGDYKEKFEEWAKTATVYGFFETVF